jgi:hypothetical protein
LKYTLKYFVFERREGKKGEAAGSFLGRKEGRKDRRLTLRRINSKEESSFLSRQ